MDIDKTPTPLRTALDDLPEVLRTPVTVAVERLADDAEWPDDEALLAELPRVWAMSEFASRVCVRDPAVLRSLAETGDLAVGALFVVLAVYNFVRAAFADPSGLHKQENSCRWSWGWQGP